MTSQNNLEADLRRAQMPQGYRRGHRGFDRVRGRRLREVRHGVGLRGVGGPGALRALQRRVPIPRRDNQGRQQAPEKAARRGRLALQGSVEVAERPGQGAGSRRSDQATRQRGREAARRQAPLHGRCGQAEQRGQRRGGARAGLLVLGRGPNGGRRLAGAPRTYPGLSRNSRARRASASILGFFSCGGEAATHAKRQTRRRGRP